MRPTTLGSINALDISLGRTSLRGAALANNLANVNTPGYKRVDLRFDDALQAAMAGNQSQPRLALTVTSAAHRLPATQQAGLSSAAEIVQSSGTTLRNDGNNVDVEAEMAVLAENSIYYQALVHEINNRLGVLRMAITEGRR